MNHPTVQRAQAFVDQAALPPAPPRRRGAEDASTTAAALQAGKQQAAVVGSDLLTFATGVDSPWRQDLTNSSLLAQLVAKKRVPDATRLFDWYDAYFDTLQQIGWAVQDRTFAVYAEQGQNFETHQAILKVATALLGPATASLALVVTALEALQSMNSDSPWITLFNRESQTSSTGRFQIGVVEQASNGELAVSMLAFGLEAKSTLTQVLFFKSRADQVTLRNCSGKVAVDTTVLAGVRAGLQAKLVGYANDFIKTLPDL